MQHQQTVFAKIKIHKLCLHDSPSSKYAYLQCDPLQQEYVGTEVYYQGYEYHVESPTTLRSLFPIDNYNKLTNFSIALGLPSNLIQLPKSKHMFIDNIIYPRPTISFNFSKLMNAIRDEKFSIMYMLPTSEINKFPSNIEIGREVLFKDEFGNLLAGQVVNSIGTIRVDYTDFYTQWYSEKEKTRFINTIHPNLVLMENEQGLFQPSVKNALPNMYMDKMNIENMSFGNFIYLKDGIIQSANPEQEAFVYKMNHIPKIDQMFVGNIISYQDEKYLITASKRAMSLIPSYQAINVVNTPYQGSKLQAIIDPPAFLINFDELILLNTYQTSNVSEVLNNQDLSFYDGTNRLILELPPTQDMCIQGRLRKYDNGQAQVGDIIEVSFNDKSITPVKFIVADYNHLISSFDAKEATYLLDYKPNYDIEILPQTTRKPVTTETLNTLNQILPEDCKCQYTPDVQANDNPIKLLIENLTLNIVTDNETIDVKFNLKCKGHNNTNNLYLTPIEDETFKKHERLIESCLVDDLNSIPGTPKLTWSYTTNTANIRIPQDQINYGVYRVEIDKLTTSFSRIILHELTENRFAPISTWIGNPSKLHLMLKFELNPQYLPSAYLNTFDTSYLYHGTNVKNGMMIYVNGIKGVIERTEQQMPNGLMFHRLFLSVDVNDIMNIPLLTNTIDAFDGKFHHENKPELKLMVEQTAKTIKSVLKTIESTTGIKLLEEKPLTMFQKLKGEQKEKYELYEWKLPIDQQYIPVPLSTKQQKNTKEELPIAHKEAQQILAIIDNHIKSATISYKDLNITDITIPDEQDVFRIPVKYLDKDTKYWIKSETKKEMGLVNISFAMGKVIDENGEIMNRDVVLDADVFPIMRVSNLQQFGLGLGDNITIDVGNNMKDYYTVVASNILLRNSSIGKAQLSNNMQLPDIAPGATISTYSDESPVAKLIDKYIEKLNKPFYIIEQHQEVQSATIATPEIDGLIRIQDIEESLSTKEGNNTDLICRLSKIEIAIMQEQQTVQQARKLLKQTQQMLEQSIEKLSELSQAADQIKTMMPQINTHENIIKNNYVLTTTSQSSIYEQLSQENNDLDLVSDFDWADRER